MQVPGLIYLYRTGSPGDPLFLQPGATGVMAHIATDAAGAGDYNVATVPLTSPTSLAVFEVLWADPFSSEFTELPYTLSNAPPGTILQVEAHFAPFYA